MRKRIKSQPCKPGSIEQQLDMCEAGELRGDEIAHQHGVIPQPPTEGDLENFVVTMEEDGREGDELSGDEHSSGMQGGDEQDFKKKG